MHKNSPCYKHAALQTVSASFPNNLFLAVVAASGSVAASKVLSAQLNCPSVLLAIAKRAKKCEAWGDRSECDCSFWILYCYFFRLRALSHASETYQCIADNFFIVSCHRFNEWIFFDPILHEIFSQVIMEMITNRGQWTIRSESLYENPFLHNRNSIAAENIGLFLISEITRSISDCQRASMYIYRLSHVRKHT